MRGTYVHIPRIVLICFFHLRPIVGISLRKIIMRVWVCLFIDKKKIYNMEFAAIYEDTQSHNHRYYICFLFFFFNSVQLSIRVCCYCDRYVYNWRFIISCHGRNMLDNVHLATMGLHPATMIEPKIKLRYMLLTAFIHHWWGQTNNKLWSGPPWRISHQT